MSAATLSLSPSPSRFERTLQALLTGGLAGLGFFLPFSTAGTSMCLAVLLLVAGLMGTRVWQARAWREPVFGAGLLLLAYIALRTLAELGWQADALVVVNHYHELLMMPILWAVMRASRRRDAFLAGLLVGSVSLALAYWLPLPALWENKLALRRISAGFGLSLCAFVFYEQARTRRLPPWLGFGAAALLATTVVLAVEARTGYVTLAVLVVCAAWRSVPRERRWLAFTALLVAGLLVLALVSTLLREQRGDIDVTDHIRSELLHNGMALALGHWQAGTGWRGYAHAYAQVAQGHGAPAQARWAHTDNAHNEYLMQAGAGGLPALLLFLAWLAAPVVLALRTPGAAESPAGPAACLALAFAAACLFNSLLLDFIEAHLYGALLAWVMARREP
jgi:O-antigen ligase